MNELAFFHEAQAELAHVIRLPTLGAARDTHRVVNSTPLHCRAPSAARPLINIRNNKLPPLNVD
jgi:hypothetical protein